MIIFRYPPCNATDVLEKAAPLPEDMREDVEEYTSSMDFSLIQVSASCVAMTYVGEIVQLTRVTV